MQNTPSKRSCAAAAQRVLRAAADLFSRHGYDGVSMSDIAERAQVSKANIFHHYKSKSALYEAVMQGACADSAAALDALEHGTGDARERVLGYVRARLASYLDNPQATRLILRELTENTDMAGSQRVREEFMTAYDRLADMIRRGIDDGRVRADVHPGVVALVMSAANIFFAQLQPVWQQFGRAELFEDPDAFSAMVVDILFRGVSTTDGSACRGRTDAPP